MAAKVGQKARADSRSCVLKDILMIVLKDGEVAMATRTVGGGLPSVCTCPRGTVPCSLSRMLTARLF